MNIAGAIFEKKQKENGRSGLFHVTYPPDLLQEQSILLLPGNSAVNQIDAESNKQISGKLKYFHQDGYSHFGLAYSDMSSFAHSYTAYHGANERGWSNDAQDLVEQLIAPNIPSVNNRTGDDRAAQLIDCFYRFRNLKICSHSYGAMMASQLGNAVNAVMDIQGYQPDEKALLIPQIMVLNIAGITSSAHEITKNNPTFTVCDLKSLNDTTLRLAGNTLSLIEDRVEDYLGWNTPLAVVRYHEHQTGFYAKHAPAKMATKQSHAMPTYLATHPNVAAERDPFPIVYPALWDGMTDLHCHSGLTRTVEQAGPEKQAQWTWIMANQASPLDMILDKAQQNEKFAQIWQDATILDRDNFLTLQYFTPNKTDLAANSIAIPIPTTKDDNRTIVAMTDFLLNADFMLNNDRDYQVVIPPSWQTDDSQKLLEHTAKHLFYAKLSESPDEWNNPAYATGQFRIAPPDAEGQVFFQVTRNLYDGMIGPLQECNRDNLAQENLMSMAHDLYQDCLEEHQIKIQLASYRQKKSWLPQRSGPASSSAASKP